MAANEEMIRITGASTPYSIAADFEVENIFKTNPQDID
jgi:hypothetical protein